MSKNTTVKNPMKVITGEDTRWSYVNVWEPKSINGGAPKYSVSLIIPKSDTKTVAKIKAAIEAAYAEGESKLKGLCYGTRHCGRRPQSCAYPLRGVFRCLWPRKHHAVRVQLERQSRHRLRPQ